MAKKYEYLSKWFTFDGKRYVVRAKTEKELYEKVALKKRDLEEARVILNGSTTVSEWVKTAVETYKSGMSLKAGKDMWWRLNKWVLPKIGQLPIKSIKPIQCQQLLNALSGQSESLTHKVMLDLRFIFKTARQNQLVLSDPTEFLTKPATVKGVRRSLTDLERAHFLRICANTNRFILFELMLYCGCRPAEAMKCQASDIIEEKGAPLLHIRGTKTANADRFVPIPDIFYTKLIKAAHSGYLALNQHGNKHTTYSYRWAVKALRREMNLSMGAKTYRNALLPPLPLAEDFVPYMFRHTYCTDLQKAGVDIRTAQKLMGHANISITANIYTHVDRSEILKAADLINGKL